MAIALRDRFYDADAHPYRLFEDQVVAEFAGRPRRHLAGRWVRPHDARCCAVFLGKAGRLIGVELVDFTDVPDGIETYKTDLAHICPCPTPAWT
jgi:hypothetical protein